MTDLPDMVATTTQKENRVRDFQGKAEKLGRGLICLSDASQKQGTVVWIRQLQGQEGLGSFIARGCLIYGYILSRGWVQFHRVYKVGRL